MSQDTKLVEGLTIQPVPESERTGNVRHLFSFWFTVQIIPLAVVTGLLGPTIFGLDVTSTILAIVCGSVVGAVFMALHSAQGSKLGVPQMIQARAQFGMYGSVPITVIVILIYVGWIVALMVLAQQTLGAVVTGLGHTTGLLLSTTLTLVAVVVGYQLILRFNRVMVFISGLALVLTLVYTGIQAAKGDGALAGGTGTFSWAGFLGMASVVGVWQLSYAPYVSDYSRYLPATTGTRSTFWWTYLPSAVSAIWVFALGSAVAALAPDEPDPVKAFTAIGDSLAPGLGWLVSFLLFVGLLAIMAINQYGGSLSMISIIDSFRPARSGRRLRALTIVAMALIVFVVAQTVGVDRFNSFYGNALIFLAYLFTPWTAINLVDYFFVRRGAYVIREIFNPRGMYGRWGWNGIAAYLLSTAIMVPFFVTTPFTGFLAHRLGDVDYSMFVGLPVAGLLYWLFSRRIDLESERLLVVEEGILPLHHGSH